MRGLESLEEDEGQIVNRRGRSHQETGGRGKTIDGRDLSLKRFRYCRKYIFRGQQILFDFQKKGNRNIKSVFLTGGGSALRDFRELATQNFKVEVISGDPFEKVETPAFLRETLKITGPEFTVANLPPALSSRNLISFPRR